MVRQMAPRAIIAESLRYLEDFFDTTANDFMFEGFENSGLISKKLVKKSFVDKNTAAKERQYSNGENALKFFKNEIQPKTLYLLDEPENSMSPRYQLELKSFLESCAKIHGCQFVIATHSPFVLAINDAKIYDLDSTPVSVKKWYGLQNMKLTYAFFAIHKDLFEYGGEMKVAAEQQKAKAKGKK